MTPIKYMSLTANVLEWAAVIDQKRFDEKEALKTDLKWDLKRLELSLPHQDHERAALSHLTTRFVKRRDLRALREAFRVFALPGANSER